MHDNAHTLMGVLRPLRRRMLFGFEFDKRLAQLVIEAVGSAGRVTFIFDNDVCWACSENTLTRLARRVFVKVEENPV